MTSEIELPWSLVVESDEVYSTAVKRWFTVESTERTRAGIVIKAEGVAKPWPPQRPAKMVKVRRGPTGLAVDVLQVIFSGERQS